ncbi:hypothetical protein [Streptococcus agalactiae]|uniref:hypothetical protein n=1 Tax=Streptococcus agalactiae TaxID=1311 RepID=UPI001C9421E5|nr:hypothetical protein [Streptococcus agalactiae]MBY5050936.1 hypothetical protein [Streptococcus agalactiae]
MKKYIKLLCLGMLSVGLVFIASVPDSVFAEENVNSVLTLDSGKVEVINVTKDDIISNYSQVTGVSDIEAAAILFPEDNVISFRSAGPSTQMASKSYVMLRAAIQDHTFTQNLPKGAGSVYFYCQVSTSGGFRGIQRIIYGGYNAGSKAFSGNFQYFLPDPNRIHYTVSGQLFSNTTVTTSAGGSIGIGEGTSVNIGVSSTTKPAGSILHHGDITY